MLNLPCLPFHLPYLLGNGTSLLTLFALLQPWQLTFKDDILDLLEEELTKCFGEDGDQTTLLCAIGESGLGVDVQPL